MKPDAAPTNRKKVLVFLAGVKHAIFFPTPFSHAADVISVSVLGCGY
jgi:hypothetical protein